MKSKLLKRALIISTMVLIVAGMVIGLALPGIAASDDGSTSSTQPAPAKILRGKVTDVSADKTSFTIQSGTQAPVIVKVDGNTKYYKIQLPIKVPVAASIKPGPTARAIPSLSNKAKVLEKLPEKQAKVVERGLGERNGKEIEQGLPQITDEMVAELDAQGVSLETQAVKPGQKIVNWLRKLAQKATFEDIAVGDRVIVRVMPNENLAKLVLIVKQPKVNPNQVHGIVTSLTGTTIGITPANSTTEVVLAWDANTRFVLQGLIAVMAGQGQIATAVYSTDSSGNKLAKAVTVKKPAPAPTTTSQTTR